MKKNILEKKINPKLTVFSLEAFSTSTLEAGI